MPQILTVGQEYRKDTIIQTNTSLINPKSKIKREKQRDNQERAGQRRIKKSSTTKKRERKRGLRT